MYAVVQTGGKQYKVREGEVLRVERLPGKKGEQVTFEQVLLFSDGETLRIGQPRLEGMTVSGHILEQDRNKKIIVFKYKRRKRYRRKQGHRQEYTAVQIDRIGAGAPESMALSAKPETVDVQADAPAIEAAAAGEIKE